MSFLLLGARGTGKTWLMREQFSSKSLLWIDLLLHKSFFKYQKNPALLRSEIKEAIKQEENYEKEWVIIDEVQRIPQLLNEVHSIVEDQDLGGRIKFGLLGSSARKLKRGGANLLAGRALMNELFPLSHQEMAQDFVLEDVLSWGSLPAVIKQPDILTKTEILETYIGVYLREEIREEQIVRDLDPFSKFLEVAAQSSGKIVNYSKIGRDCSVDSRAVARYFQILEETLLGSFLKPYHRSVRKQQGKGSKFYFFDLGVMRALEGTLQAPINKASYGYGRLFEHFVILEIMKLNSYLRTRYKLFYLITKQGSEIDLIIERKGKPDILIEIKSGVEPKMDDAIHLKNLKEHFPGSELWVISQVENNFTDSGVRFLHWEYAIQEIFKI